MKFVFHIKTFLKQKKKKRHSCESKILTKTYNLQKMMVIFFECNNSFPIFQCWCYLDLFKNIVSKIRKENLEVTFGNEKEEQIYIDENFVTKVSIFLIRKKFCN